MLLLINPRKVFLWKYHLAYFSTYIFVQYPILLLDYPQKVIWVLLKLSAPTTHIVVDTNSAAMDINSQHLAIRDILIHRNAIDTEGYFHRIKKSQLLQALDVIKNYIRHIFDALNDFETNITVEQMINKE